MKRMIFPLAILLCMFYSCSGDEGEPKKKVVEVPDVQIACESLAAIDMSDADIVLSGPDCSEEGLRNAIEQGGKILCDCGESTITISSELEITENVILDGGNVTLDGDGNTRIFHKLPEPNVDFTLQNITLQNGRSENSGAIFLRSGGLIMARSYDSDMAMGGTLTCINVTFEDSRTQSLSQSDVAGGAVYLFGVEKATFSECVFNNNSSSNGGAIGGIGSPVEIINSVFANNDALGDNGIGGFGGAIYLDGTYSGTAGLEAESNYTVCGTQFVNNQSVRFGGASTSVVSRNTATVISFDKCTFSQNRAGINGGYYSGGAIYHVDDLDEAVGANNNSFSLTNSTLMENEAAFQGGGLWIICNEGVIANSTFYRNSALDDNALGGAIAFAEANGYGGNYLMTNCTLAENFTNNFSAGMYIAQNNYVTFTNSIFYNNLGTFRYQGHLINGDDLLWEGTDNLQYPKVFTNEFGEEVVDFSIQGAPVEVVPLLTDDPLLDIPADNGGYTFTMALKAGSPAIDAGNPASATLVDQRGVTRGKNPDLGAYEVEQ